MDKVFEAIAGNIIVLAVFLVPICIVGITSYFSHKRLELVHRERLAAIEKGMMPPGRLTDPQEEKHEEEGPKPAPNYLGRGLFWLCPGVGVVVFSVVALDGVGPGIQLPILGVSVLCAGIGAAYLAIHFVQQDRARRGLQ